MTETKLPMKVPKNIQPPRGIIEETAPITELLKRAGEIKPKGIEKAAREGSYKILREWGFKKPEETLQHIESMSQSELDPENQKRFYKTTLPDLLKAIKDRPDKDEIFRRLNATGDIFEKAGRNPESNKIDFRFFRKLVDKHFLFSLIEDNPQAIEAVTDLSSINIAQNLSMNARFTCLLFLSSIAETPDYHHLLTAAGLKREPKDISFQSMNDQVNRDLLDAETRAKKQEGFSELSNRKQKTRVFEAQVDALRKFAHVGLARVGISFLRNLIDLPPDEDAMDEVQRKDAYDNMDFIHDEMANLSNVLLRKCLKISGPVVEAEYGKPGFWPNPVKYSEKYDKLLTDFYTNHDEGKKLSRVFSQDRLSILLQNYGQRFVEIDRKHAKGDSSYLADAKLLRDNLWNVGLNGDEREAVVKLYSESPDATSTPPDVLLVRSLRKAYRRLHVPAHYAILVAGAGGRRKEYPSFDYDIFDVYSDEGLTTLGRTNKRYFNALHKRIKNTIFAIDHDADFGFPTITPASTDKLFSHFQSNSAESRLEMYKNTELAYGAGSTSLAGEVIKGSHKVLYDPEERGFYAPLIYARRLLRHHMAEISKRDGNVKVSPGGIRDIHDAMWIYKINHGLIDLDDVPKTLDKMVELGDLDEKKHDQLRDSFKFLLNLRIRLDLHYGKNTKDLPGGLEYNRFIFTLGYKDTPGEGTAEERFQRDLEKHMKRVGKITDAFIKKQLGANGLKRSKELYDEYFNPYTLNT
ncbi:hypothetical protein ACFLRC_01830 [Candidatus Altiarchaeota archaeon]